MLLLGTGKEIVERVVRSFHSRMDDAFSALSGMQQPSSPMIEFDEEDKLSHAEVNSEIELVIVNFIVDVSKAFGYKVELEPEELGARESAPWYVDFYDSEMTLKRGFPTSTYICKNFNEVILCHSLLIDHYYSASFVRQSVGQSPRKFNQKDFE